MQASDTALEPKPRTSILCRIEHSPRLQLVVLALIVALGAGLRLYNVDWDDGTHLHPDERFLTMVENGLSWPTSLNQYWDTANNPLNPYNSTQGSYVYGLFPVAAAKLAGEASGYTGYFGVHLAGRVLSALADIGSILLVFFIGRRLYSAKVGLLGAFLLSVSVLAIQNSHFFTVDNFTTFFVTLALYYAVRVAQGRSWRNLIALGFAFGMAASCKINTLSFLAVIGPALLLRMQARKQSADTTRRRWRLVVRLESPKADAPTTPPRPTSPLWRAALEMLVVLIVAFFTFRIVQPQAFMGPGFFGLTINDKWVSDMAMISKLVSGQIDYPPSHQWTARTPIWYSFKNLVLWGQGLPLGLATWFGWGLMAWQLARRREWRHLLPWIWMTLTFFYSSVQFVKTVRYLLPIYPTMALIAAWGLSWLMARTRERLSVRTRWRIWQHRLAWIAAGTVALGTLLWALAFCRIYTQPVTRITASRWMFANLPKGTALTWEEWDDPLPLSIDGHAVSELFNQIKTSPYGEDTPDKREELYSWLEQTEYIVLSSNRLYGSIPRLPMRYPMTTRYYEALFSGELGFDLYQTFTSRPGLFGIEIVDDDADETFTVYDHPKVLIFKKNASFSSERLRELFGGYDLEHVVRMMPRDVGRAPNCLMLSNDRWASQQSSSTWSALYPAGNLFSQAPTLSWLAVLWLLGLIGFAYLFVPCRPLRDNGYAISKMMGLLLAGWLSWLIPSLKLVPYSRTLLAAILGVLAVGAVIIFVRHRAKFTSFIRWRWRQLVMMELLFIGLFMLMWLVRTTNPDLWHPALGGEKPMELAYLNAILRSEYFPPYDPWFAGGYLNYYYLGWVLVAYLIKLTATVPAISFNLAIPTWFALTGMGAFGLVFNIVGPDQPRRWLGRSVLFGLAAAALTVLAGNLAEVGVIARGWMSLGESAARPGAWPIVQDIQRLFSGMAANLFRGETLPVRQEWWYWNASRVMPNGEITEFPYFTFLYADLHPHMLDMPFFLMSLVLGLNLARYRPRLEGADWLRQITAWPWAAAGFTALSLGFSWCANTWDLPASVALIAGMLALGLYQSGMRVTKREIVYGIALLVVILVASNLLYRPFHANYGAAYTSVSPWTGARTSLLSLIAMFGLQLYILYTSVSSAVLGRQARGVVARAVRVLLPKRRWQRSIDRYRALVNNPSPSYQLAWFGIGLLMAALLFGALLGAWVLVVVLPLAVFSAWLAIRSESRSSQRLLGLLSFAGAMLVIGVEYVVIKGDIGRMNTVFKFYLQVWLIWGAAAGIALSETLPRLKTWPAGRHAWWQTLLALLIVAAASYPILATPAKVQDRWQYPAPTGLDGLAYMPLAEFHDQDQTLTLAYDARGIAWMQSHVQGTPVIAEGAAPPYRWGSRYSINTGLPTIIGWDWHQKQQRAALSSTVIDWRLNDLVTLYSSPNPEAAMEIVARYNVRYIVVGELESVYYHPVGLAKFERMVGDTLEVAYRDGPLTIYHVLER
ncbi:MAG: hypothetical protein GXY52_03490 [Chloroflexi bacterium]|nr:hypothetical protein [Chloroflexota bacterium]